MTPNAKKSFLGFFWTFSKQKTGGSIYANIGLKSPNKREFFQSPNTPICQKNRFDFWTFWKKTSKGGFQIQIEKSSNHGVFAKRPNTPQYVQNSCFCFLTPFLPVKNIALGVLYAKFKLTNFPQFQSFFSTTHFHPKSKLFLDVFNFKHKNPDFPKIGHFFKN